MKIAFDAACVLAHKLIYDNKIPNNYHSLFMLKVLISQILFSPVGLASPVECEHPACLSIKRYFLSIY